MSDMQSGEAGNVLHKDRLRHNSRTDMEAYQKFMEGCDARALQCLEFGEIAFTDDEAKCWQAMAEAMRMTVKAMPYLGDEQRADVEAMRRRKNEFKMTMIRPLQDRFEFIRTHAERDMVTARIDGMNEALNLFSHCTGIYG